MTSGPPSIPKGTSSFFFIFIEREKKSNLMGLGPFKDIDESIRGTDAHSKLNLLGYILMLKSYV